MADIDIQQFPTGWNHELEEAARFNLQQSVRPLFGADMGVGDEPLPDAFSLSEDIYNWTNQGPEGSCFSDAATQMQMIAEAGLKRAGANVKLDFLSRWMGWYVGRTNDGSIGSRQAGGTISGVMKGIAETGLCLDSSAPYKPSLAYLDRKPSATAFEEAKIHRITGLLYPKTRDEIRRCIFNRLPPVDGVWWCYGWDQGLIDQYGRTTKVGYGRFGHALVRVGYAMPGTFDDNHIWWQWKNSHGPIYPVLKPEWAARVKGYKSCPLTPGKDYCFWVRDDHMQTVINKGWAECVAGIAAIGNTVNEKYSWMLNS